MFPCYANALAASSTQLLSWIKNHSHRFLQIQDQFQTQLLLTGFFQLQVFAIYCFSLVKLFVQLLVLRQHLKMLPSFVNLHKNSKNIIEKCI